MKAGSRSTCCLATRATDPRIVLTYGILPFYQDGLAVGEHRVFVVSPGQDGFGEGEFKIQDGHIRQHLVKLRRSSWLQGRLENQSGEPLQDVEVWAEVEGVPEKIMRTWGSARTAEDGSFHVFAAHASTAELHALLGKKERSQKMKARQFQVIRL